MCCAGHHKVFSGVSRTFGGLCVLVVVVDDMLASVRRLHLHDPHAFRLTRLGLGTRMACLCHIRKSVLTVLGQSCTRNTVGGDGWCEPSDEQRALGHEQQWCSQVCVRSERPASGYSTSASMFAVLIWFVVGLPLQGRGPCALCFCLSHSWWRGGVAGEV
ncbi:hypothetical protein EJ03DRAFT_206649 [Teratosphaeria nubilosa]|uniref:Uncharacterized protein n=1 Tax=Teratosphaeria nubilosa TaxID=161662 RepID=A0A6G1KXY3_9PEZI|nr:hypothetical protein EJ03DRAFT_206649 [Teratosphaeria nubilosa]